MRLAYRVPRLRIIMQFDPQTAKRNAKKRGGMRAITVAAHKRIENVLPFDIRQGTSRMCLYHIMGPTSSN